MTSFCANQSPPGTAVPGTSVSPDSPSCRCAGEQTALAVLIDERRALAAQVAGKDVEIAMALGDRDAAQIALKEMKAQVEARWAVREACYFDAQGEIDAQGMRAV